MPTYSVEIYDRPTNGAMTYTMDIIIVTAEKHVYAVGPALDENGILWRTDLERADLATFESAPTMPDEAGVDTKSFTFRELTINVHKHASAA